MKIKSDFITNSSSTSYLIFIPDGFDVSKFIHIILDKYKLDIKDVMGVSNMETIDEFIIEFCDKFNILVDNGELDHYDNSYYHLIVYLLNELGLIINESSVSGDEDGVMWNINSKSFNKKLTLIKKGEWGLTHGGWGHENKE